MVNTDIQPSAVMETSTDQNGNWQVDLPQNLPAGLHTIVVKDEKTGEQDVAFFSVQSRQVTTFVDRAVGFVPSWVLYVVLFFVFVVLVLAANNLKLALRGKKEKKSEIKQLSFYSVILSLTALIISVGVGAVIIVGLLRMPNEQDAALANLSTSAAKQVTTIDRFTGAVVDPLSGDLVKDVELAHNEVKISTQAGGNFVFTSIPAGDRIALSSDKVSYDFGFLVPQDGLYKIWYFSPEMYNFLGGVLRDESENNLSTIYSELAEGAKKSLNKEMFIEKYQGLYVGIPVDKLSIVSIKKLNEWKSTQDVVYPQAFEVILQNGDREQGYYLVHESGSWRLAQ